MNALGKEFLFCTIQETFDKNEKKALEISEKFILSRLDNNQPLLVFSFSNKSLEDRHAQISF